MRALIAEHRAAANRQIDYKAKASVASEGNPESSTAGAKLVRPLPRPKRPSIKPSTAGVDVAMHSEDQRVAEEQQQQENSRASSNNEKSSGVDTLKCLKEMHDILEQVGAEEGKAERVAEAHVVNALREILTHVRLLAAGIDAISESLDAQYLITAPAD